MKRIFEYLLGVVIFLAMIALFSLAAMFLWNELLPDIFGLPVINYWQTVGLLILARIIFGGYGGVGKDRAHGLSGHKNPIRDRWDSMSEEARKAFIKKHGDSFLHGHFHHHSTGDTGKETDAEKDGLSGRKNPIRDRWDSMSEEVRKAFIKNHGDFFLHDHFHHHSTDDTEKE